MTPYERITIVRAIDDIESARIAMGAMFGKKGNNNEWGECAFFCSLRDILCTTREQLESYMELHEQQEKRKKKQGEKTVKINGCAYYDSEIKTCRRSEVPREHGEWVDIENGIEYDWPTCSICGGRTMMARRYYPFCPHCGADMRGKKE